MQQINSSSKQQNNQILVKQNQSDDQSQQTPSKIHSNHNQSQSSPFQISDMTPSTQYQQLKFNQQQNNPSLSTSSQQQADINILVYLPSSAHGSTHEQQNRDITPRKQIGMINSGGDSQSNRNSITPKICRQPSQNQQQYPNQDDNRSSFSYFKGLQGTDVKTPGAQLSNQKQSFKQLQQFNANMQGQELSPVQPNSHLSPLILRGDIDEDLLTGSSIQPENNLKSSQNNAQLSSNKETNQNANKRQSAQMNERNKQIKKMLIQEQNSDLQLNSKPIIKNYQDDEPLSIKVEYQISTPAVEGVQISDNTMSNNQTNPNMSSDVEVWRCTNNTKDYRKDHNNYSFQDSDVADEFEYLYDPQYLAHHRVMSPQTRIQQNDNSLQMAEGQQQKRQSSNTPPTAKQVSSRITKSQKKNVYSFQRSQVSPFRVVENGFMQGLEEYEKYELIKRTCKNTTKNANLTEIEKVNEFKRKKNNFINRMMIDVCLRDNRDKNFNEIKYVVDMQTNHDFDSISRSISPQRKDRSNQNLQSQEMLQSSISPRSRRNNKESMQSQSQASILNKVTSAQTIGLQESPNPNPHLSHHSPIFNSPPSNIGLSSQTLFSPQATQKKKLKKKDCIQIYNRFMLYEQGRQQAIEMLQEAKRKDEDAEYLQSTGNRRLTKKQKKQCYNRLAEDAERRRIALIKSQQQKEMMEEQTMKENQFRARQMNHRKSNKTEKTYNTQSNYNLFNQKKQSVQNLKQQECNDLQNHYEQYEQMKHNLIQQQEDYEDQQQYEQYLMQREQDQDLQDQNEIINIQSHKSLSSQERPESSYNGSQVDVIDEQITIFNSHHPVPLASRPKFKIGSNALTGAKLTDQQIYQQQILSSNNQQLQLIHEQSQDSVTDEYYQQ